MSLTSAERTRVAGAVFATTHWSDVLAAGRNEVLPNVETVLGVIY